MDRGEEFGIATLMEGTDGVRLRPSGELDLYTAPKLEEAVRGQLGDGRVQVTLDMSRTTFIDSSGMGTLVRLAKVVTAGGGNLRVTSPTPQIARLFEISGVHQFLNLAIGD